MAVKHTYATKNGTTTRQLTSMKAIRAKCMECSCWVTPEVKKCQAYDCAIWPFRMGRNPKKEELLKTG